MGHDTRGPWFETALTRLLTMRSVTQPPGIRDSSRLPSLGVEEFSLWQASTGNKTTAICGQNNGDIAIFAVLSTPPGGEATFQPAPMIFAERRFRSAPQERTSCSKPSFYSGARRRGSVGEWPSSSRSQPLPCGMPASDHPVAAASGVNLSEKRAPVGLRFSTVMAAECSSAMRWTIESPSPVLPGLLRSRRQNR
jgi:hypothetical protein